MDEPASALDPIATHQHRPSLVRLILETVPDASWNEQRYAHELTLLEAEELRPGIADYLSYAEERGLKRAEVLRKFNSIAELAGIGDYMDQPVKHYSMGMRTRLAFSICAHVEAEILVVDEALAVGDAAFQRKCLDWIDDFRKKGTLLFVSHSMAEVRRLCTRAIWIEDGRIREQGDPSEVIRSYHRALLVEKDDVHRFTAGA